MTLYINKYFNNTVSNNMRTRAPQTLQKQRGGDIQGLGTFCTEPKRLSHIKLIQPQRFKILKCVTKLFMLLGRESVVLSHNKPFIAVL